MFADNSAQESNSSVVYRYCARFLFLIRWKTFLKTEKKNPSNGHLRMELL